ncbi:MAG: PAS domain S-box protein, partial [Sphingobacteriales bacterium]
MNQPVPAPFSHTNDFTFFEARPGVAMVLEPDAPVFTIVAVSNDFETTTGMKRANTLGKGHFAVFPENPADLSSTGIHSLRNSFEYVLLHRKPHSLPLVRYDIPDGAGGFLEKYWKSTNAPVLNAAGDIEFLIHTSEDVTAQVKAAKADEEHQLLLQAFRRVEESERKYRSLFESLDRAFMVVELIYDVDGNPVDHLFVETNPEYEAQTGLKDVLGKTGRQVVPDIEPHWFERYDQVLKSGKALRFIEESKALGRWFEVFVNPAGPAQNKRVTVLFSDVTARKKWEASLRASEQRQSFLLRLNDHLRPLSDPAKIQYEAARLIAGHLGADRVGFALDAGDGRTVEISTDYAESAGSIKGVHSYNDFGTEVQLAFRVICTDLN